MKDEIKEIEEWLRDISTPTGLSYSGDRTLSNSMADHIIDYITNLQEEKEDYKSRNEKAIELLKEAGCYDEETKTFCDDVWEELPNLLNILNGDDKK